MRLRKRFSGCQENFSKYYRIRMINSLGCHRGVSNNTPFLQPYLPQRHKALTCELAKHLKLPESTPLPNCTRGANDLTAIEGKEMDGKGGKKEEKRIEKNISRIPSHPEQTRGSNSRREAEEGWKYKRKRNTTFVQSP